MFSRLILFSAGGVGGFLANECLFHKSKFPMIRLEGKFQQSYSSNSMIVEEDITSVELSPKDAYQLITEGWILKGSHLYDLEHLEHYEICGEKSTSGKKHYHEKDFDRILGKFLRDN